MTVSKLYDIIGLVQAAGMLTFILLYAWYFRKLFKTGEDHRNLRDDIILIGLISLMSLTLAALALAMGKIVLFLANLICALIWEDTGLNTLRKMHTQKP